jgi:hypothetical protein
VEDSGGAAAKVFHEDPNAALINIWTEWNIDLKDFSGQGANLNNIKKFSIGFGDTENPRPGVGLVFFDDIRLYPPRYVPGKITPLAADFTGDGIVDIHDLEIMTGDWLQGDYTIYATEPEPPVALWAFDNNVDDSAGGNNGIINGNPGYVAGMFNQAISLDGDDYVDCGNSDILNFAAGDWTVCAWIKTTQSGTGDENKGTVFANGGDQTGGIRYTLALNETQSGNITLTTDDDTTKAQATSSILVNDDAWHHVVGIRNGTGLQVYVNGVLDGTNTVPVGYDLSGTSQHNAYIGAITDFTNGSLIKYFVGLIDDVRIYDYALSQAEIMSVMGQSELYIPVTSPANISDEEPVNSRMVNLRDFAVLADEWLAEPLWPK